MKQPEATVLGGGVIGLCSAWYLQAAGWKVTIVDQNGGTSYGNAGMIVPSHFVPLASPGVIGQGMKMLLNSEGPFGFGKLTGDVRRWVWEFQKACTAEHVSRCRELLLRMHRESKDEYVAFAERFPQMGLVQKGLLALCAEPQTLAHEAELARAGTELGLKVRVVEDVTAADPSITMQAAGAVLFEEDAHFNPGAFMTALREEFLAQGGEWQTRAIHEDDLRPGEGLIVVATGAKTQWVGEKLGCRWPMLAGKGYSWVVPNPPQMPELCSLLMEARVAVTPLAEGLRFAGTMEIGPPDDRSVNPKRLRGIARSIPRYFPAFEGLEPPADPWVGLRPVTPDGMPYLGRLRNRPDVIVAAGHGMMGMSLGPVTGKWVAQLAGEAGETPAVLSPHRYGT